MAQGLERSSSNQKVCSSIPVSLSPHANVSLNKILNPKLPLLLENVLHIDVLYDVFVKGCM